VHRLDVLGGVERLEDLGFGVVGLQGTQDQDAGDPRIGVEPADDGEQVGLLRRRRQAGADVVAAHGLREHAHPRSYASEA
jgi:hypothetical protein